MRGGLLFLIIIVIIFQFYPSKSYANLETLVIENRNSTFSLRLHPHRGHRYQHRTYNNNHSIELFMGVTSNIDEFSNMRFTTGLDFEHQLPPKRQVVGFGMLTRFIIDDSNEYTFCPLFSVYPFKILKLMLAPGILFKDNDIDFILKAGTGLKISFNHFIITPRVEGNFVNGDISLTYGLTLGGQF